MTRGIRLSLATTAATVLCFAAPPVPAQVTAHFRAQEVNGGCLVNSQESIFQGDPERYFRLGVFDNASAPVFNACANGCSDDGSPTTADGRTYDQCGWSTGCGSWNFADLTLSKVTQNNSGAYFYFGLWDEDADADDSLGDHWLFLTGPSSGTFLNNNSSPYFAGNPIATVCGRTLEGIGDAGNFWLSYSAWFTDQSPPSVPSNLRLVDDGIEGAAWDNDTSLSLAWTQGSDPHSGISAHAFRLWDSTDGVWVFPDEPAGANGMTVCTSGCQAAYTPVHGHSYLFAAGATNGSFPRIQNPTGSTSPYVAFGVDLVDPVSVITAPPAASWQASDFGVLASDSDSGSALDLCEIRVLSSGVQTLDWSARTCNTLRDVSVGPSSNCRDEGASTCAVEIRSTDFARRKSSIDQRVFSIDFTPDAVLEIFAFEQPGGEAIAPGAWSAYTDPYFEIDFAASTAPLAGPSWAVDAEPDCVADGAPADPFSLQLEPQADGPHSFAVRQTDAAGNCGATVSFAFGVDTTGDAIGAVSAEAPGGETILDGVWTNLDPVTMTWTVPVSGSPIDSYSWSLGEPPDCIGEISTASVALGGQIQGSTTFQVRVIDHAGNCGPASEPFLLAVDTAADVIPVIDASTEPGGEGIAPGVWQSDDDPFMTWIAPESTSPIAGYAVGVDETPMCAVQISDPEYQFPTDALDDGLHQFYVRPLDAAGNCGSVASFAIAVSSTAGSSPGRIQDDLQLSRGAGPDDVELSWSAGCNPLGTDYTVHEGALGLWYSHEQVLCTTSGSTSAAFQSQLGNRYFLIVPRSLSDEGSYGLYSGNAERPPSAPACLPQALPTACP